MNESVNTFFFLMPGDKLKYTIINSPPFRFCYGCHCIQVSERLEF